VRDTYFVEVGGVATSRLTNEVHVSPGNHSFELGQLQAAGCSHRLSSGGITFEAKAGHKYGIVMRHTSARVAYLWVEDLQTGKIVAGRKPLNK